MEPVQVINPSLVLVDWGPMTLSISAWLHGRPRPVMAVMGAHRALRCLAELSDFHGYLKQKTVGLKPKDSLPLVVGGCLGACQAVSGQLTGLAAVAGAVADQVAHEVAAQGADQIIVNNGGDIALQVPPGKRLRVGLRPQAVDPAIKAELIGALNVSHESAIGGVATSGWQGRSFSPGLADLVTVWARDAARADAAATWIAACCQSNAPGVERIPARELNPHSDLGDMPVTVQVPRLTANEKQTALHAGLNEARRLLAMGSILGCRIEVQGSCALLDATHGSRLGAEDGPREFLVQAA